MRKILLFIYLLMLCGPAAKAQFSMQGGLGKSFITTGDFHGINYSVGLGYDLSRYFTITLHYESATASKRSRIIGNLRSNDSVTVTAAFRSQKTNLSNATVYNVYDYYSALAILKEKPDRVTCNSIKIGIDLRPLQWKRHEFSLGLKVGISKIVTSMFVQANSGVYTPTWSLPEKVIIVTPFFSNVLDMAINPNLKYYYHLSPTISLGATFNPDYFYYSGDLNWNFGIASRIKLHKAK